MAMPGNPKNSSQRATSKVGTLEAAHPSWLRARPEVKRLALLGDTNKSTTSWLCKEPKRTGPSRPPQIDDRLQILPPVETVAHDLPRTRLEDD